MNVFRVYRWLFVALWLVFISIQYFYFGERISSFFRIKFYGDDTSSVIIVAVTVGDRNLQLPMTSTASLIPRQNVAFIINIDDVAQETAQETEPIKGVIAHARKTINLLLQKTESSRRPKIMVTFLFSIPTPTSNFFTWLASENASDLFVSDEIHNLPIDSNERLMRINCLGLSSSLIKSPLPSSFSSLLSSFDFILSLRPTSKEVLTKLITPTIVREIVQQLDPTSFFATVDIHYNGKTLWNTSSFGSLTESNAIVISKDTESTETVLVPFTLTFFGGSHLKMVNLCHHIDDFLSLNNTVKASMLSLASLDHATSSNILQRFVERFLNNVAQPSHIMSSSFLYPSMLPRAYASTPLVKYDEVEVKQYVKLRRAIVESDRRIRAIKSIVDRITSRYFKNVSEALEKYESNNHTLVKKFLAFTCESSMVCGGLGDRLKGVASLFYTAIATQRIFHMDWEKPVNFDRYFHINHNWYQVPEQLYGTQRQFARQKRQWQWHIDALGDSLLAQIRENNTLMQMFDQFDSLDVSTNRLMAIESAFQNPYFILRLADIFPDLNSIQPGDAIDYSLPISAAYRLIFGSPRENTTRIVSSILDNSVGMAKWQDSLKIGIQIRKCQSVWNDGCSRIEQRHMTCFADKVKHIADAMRTGFEQTVSIFVTSDDDGAVNFFKKSFVNETRFVVFSTGSPDNNTSNMDYNITLKHLDRSGVSSDSTLAWFEMAKVYVDWLILSKMDILVISRSGYGETAGFHSLKPTLQFQHLLASQQNPCPFYDYIASATKFDFR